MSQVFIISAPSGSGKSTLVRNLMERDGNLIFSVSYTTRAPRGQETEGHEYHFVSRAAFLEMRARDEFIEWAPVFDDFYGTHRRYVDQARAEGKDAVLDIDVKGARQLRERIPEAVSVFILAPSREELEKRLRARGDVSDQVIQKRVAEAAREIRDYSQYTYVLVNEDVEVASGQLQAIVKASRQGAGEGETAGLRSDNAAVQKRVTEILATFE
ncbi:MAG: guanylate kinase [Acidobacteria bacterium]|nr:guanylate kinase [Acidobacteriota bacterium]